MKEIDARGLACPAPVLRTKALLDQEKPDLVRVIADNAASQENVRRFLDFQGFTTTLERSGEDYIVLGRRTSAPSETPRPHPVAGQSEGNKIMVVCATDRMGYGDDALGLKLMMNFIGTLKEMGPDLWRLVFVNNGVKLCIQGAETLPVLKTLEASGVHILVCGTCLNYFNLLDQKQVGETTNMLDIVTGMQVADKVISL